MNKYLIVFILFVLSNPLYSRIDTIFKGQTSIKNPFELRDPFQPPKFKSRSSKRIKERSKGILDNVERYTGEYDLEKIVIVGILIGKERRVLVRIDKDQSTYTLREGEKIGSSGPVIKAILPGGVILVEKITNIYGESEFIETVVPISK
jgi:type IV pilus assembly protein PilP